MKTLMSLPRFFDTGGEPLSMPHALRRQQEFGRGCLLDDDPFAQQHGDGAPRRDDRRG